MNFDLISVLGYWNVIADFSDTVRFGLYWILGYEFELHSVGGYWDFIKDYSADVALDYIGLG